MTPQYVDILSLGAGILQQISEGPAKIYQLQRIVLNIDNISYVNAHSPAQSEMRCQKCSLSQWILFPIQFCSKEVLRFTLHLYNNRRIWSYMTDGFDRLLQETSISQNSISKGKLRRKKTDYIFQISYILLHLLIDYF